MYRIVFAFIVKMFISSQVSVVHISENECIMTLVMGGSRGGAQGACAPSKPMTGRSGLIDSVLLALPVRFQNVLKHA